MTYQKGFTLIEIMIVLAIFGMILTFGLIATLDSFKRNTVQAEESILVSALEKARSRSMSNMFGSTNGVCYIAPNYVIFRGTVCNPLLSTNELISANENIANLSNFSDSTKFPTIVFSQLAGTTTNATIYMTDGVKSATTIINYEGTINW